MGRFGVFSRFAFLCAAPSLLAAPHRYRVHPDPSITILEIAEDREGVFWLAAQDGLYSFDGLHYHKIPDFPLESARFVTFTSDGSMWVAGSQGLVRRKDHFEVVLREEVIGMLGLSDQVLIKVQNSYRGVRLDGSLHSYNHHLRGSFTNDPSGLVWFAPPGRFQAIAIDPHRPDTLVEQVPLPELAEQVVRDSLGRMWTADGSRAVAFQDGRQVRILTRRESQKTQRPYPLLPGRNGQLWFLGESLHGLSPPIEFLDRAPNDQYQPTAGYEDSRGHFWIAKLGLGLVEWIPDSSWHRWFSESFAGQPVSQIVRTRGGSLIAGTRGTLYHLDPSRDVWLPVTGVPKHYSALLALDNGDLLASIRRFGVARLSPAEGVLERPPNPLRSMDEYRCLIEDRQGRIWVGNKLGLLRLEGRPGSLHLVREPLPDVNPSWDAQAVDFQLDASGNPWVGYLQGIAHLDADGQWHRLPTDEPVTEIRSFALADPVAGSDIWVAHRRSGFFSRLRKQGNVWKVARFSSAAGYGPEDTHFIRRDSRGWIWRGAPDGVHISDGIHVEPNDWIHLSPQNGLATDGTDLYGFFEDADGTVWISGEDGISHLKPDPSWFDAPHTSGPPHISSVQIDGREQARSGTSPTFPVPETSLRLEIGSLETPAFRDAPFRYRLRPLSREWRLSSDGTLEFAHLAPRDYTLEVAFTGNGSAPVLVYPFRIGSPATPFTWSWLLSLPLGGGVFALFVRFFPWPEKLRYRFGKDWFVLRRRLRPQPGGSDPARPARHRTGDIVAGRYELLRSVSRGGFSIVYEARDLHHEPDRVALKILSAGAGTESWLRDRFAHEITALQSIHHPAVVRVLDSWISPEGEPCLTMPFLDGPTLRQALEAGPLAPARVAALLRQLGSALDEIHSRGIVHRDLKPENVILTGSSAAWEQPVLIDFGTAALRGRHGELATTTLLAGSFHYMAPERLSGHYSAASDVYSLGVIVLEMLTAKRLADMTILTGDELFREELQKLLAAVLEPNVAQRVSGELCRTWEPKPQERPVDVRIWSETLAALLGECR